MQLVAQYSPVSGQSQTVGSTYLAGWFVITNDSDAQLSVQALGGTVTIVSGYANIVPIPRGGGAISIFAAPYIAQPGYAQLVTVEAYQPGELPSTSGYPVAVGRSQAQTINNVLVSGSQQAPSPGNGNFTVVFPSAPSGKTNYLTGFLVTAQQGHNSPTTRYNCTILIQNIKNYNGSEIGIFAVQSEYGLLAASQFPFPLPQAQGSSAIQCNVSGFSNNAICVLFGTQQ